MIRWLIVVWLMCFSALSFAQSVYEFKANTDTFLVTQYDLLNPSALKVSSVSSVLAAPGTAWQTKSQEHYIQLEKGKNWLRFDLQNYQKMTASTFITVSNRLSLNDIKVFVVDRQHDVYEQPFNLLNNDMWASSVSIDAHSRATVYLLIDVGWKTNLQIKLKREGAFVDSTFDAQFSQGFAIGGMLCLSLASLFLYFGTGNGSLLWLFAFFMTRSVLLSVTMGYNLYYMLPEYPELRGIEFPLLNSLTAIFYYLFIIDLFRIKRNMPKALQYIKGVCAVLLLYMPISLIVDLQINALASFVMHFIVTLSLVVLGWKLHKQNVRLSLAIMIISLIQLSFGLLYFVSHKNFWFDQANTLMFVGFWLHSILVIFLLSRLYRHQTEDKQAAQKQALSQAMATKRAQQELLELQNTTQEELEARVQERTLELNIALQELEEVNQELEEKNTLDELTTLYNRRFYDQKLLAEFRRSKRNLTPLSLLLVDIDFFKQVNDEYGHLAGDRCLISVASLIKLNSQRSTDIACRYGGEEFVIILPETDEEGAMALAEKLRKQVAEADVVVDEQPISLTISCGVSTYRQQSFANVDTLFNCADKALYRAKNEGRNQIQFLPLETN